MLSKWVSDWGRMSWGFETDPEYQELLDWADSFVRHEVELLDLVAGNPYDKSNPAVMSVIRPLQQQVRVHGPWACHLGPELGGPGYGQLKLALLNEILGRSTWAPTIFGCQAPDSGNAEILAHFGTEEQKATYLAPLLAGEISSCTTTFACRPTRSSVVRARPSRSRRHASAAGASTTRCARSPSCARRST